jgi:hypothetical protein
VRIRRLLVWSAAATAGSLFVLLGPAVGASATAACPASAYAMSLQSLTGPDGADLTIRVTPTTAACAAPEALSELQVGVFRRDDQRLVLDLLAVPTPGGTGTVPIGVVHRGQIVAVRAFLATDVVLDGRTPTLLRPDLALASVSAPPETLTGRAFTIGATVTELNGDAGASATLTASANGVVLASVPVVIPAGGIVTTTLPVSLPAPGPARIDVAITAAAPAETALGNDTRSATVDVTDFQVVPSVAVGPSLAGYGGQFNENVYAAISRAAGVTDDNLRFMEQSLMDLRPQFSRIFFAQAAFNDPDMMASFVRTVLLAQRTGTTINVTWQGGTLDVKSGTVPKFAAVLVNLVVKWHVTNLRWVTLQNEPNSTKITLPQYEAQYRELDPYLANIRGQVRFMGGDLVQTNQQAWFAYLGAHMTDLLDAYSIHVFWDYWDVQKLQSRLTEVRAIVDGLPEAQRKPLYVTEYGVRGLRTFNGAAAGDPGVWMDGTPINETNVSAFEHAWFDILSSRLGYTGTSKWDTYFGRYDKGTQAYYMIGSPDRGWPKHPMYNLFYLMTASVKPGWHTVELDAVPGTTRLVTAYTGGWDWTLVGLDTAGTQLNGASTVEVPYTIGGLPPSQSFRLVVWNDVGDGLDGPATTVTTDAAGTATFTVLQQGVFTLTTRPGTVEPRNALPMP